MDQNHWRFCQKCSAMFFDGSPRKGVCPAGGGHEAQGFDFTLPHDVPPPANAQNNWRFCDKCNEMFFDGAPNSRCPAGGQHHAQGFNFVLPHDVAPTPTAQKDWRFCDKCHAMFFDGVANKGHCPAGSGHHAQGFNFVLPHSVGFGAPEVMNFDSGAVHVPGGLTLQGSAHLVVRRNGEFTFTSHAHNSGFDNINYSLAAVLRAPSGQVAFTFQKQGRVEGTVAGLPFGTPQRNDDFTSTGHNARLAAELDSVSNGGKFVVNLNGTDLLLHGITGLIQDTLQDAAKQLAQGAAGAVVALVAA
jgi:hypothetical protein